MSEVKIEKTCPQCGSKHLKKFGFALTKKRGRARRFQCLDCASSFY